jgi:hypothetical protein
MGRRNGQAQVEGVVAQMTTCHLVTLWLSVSGKAVHRVFASQAQDAFLEGPVEAFRTWGGIPTKHLRSDNLTPAVHRVCCGRTRIESPRWVASGSAPVVDVALGTMGRIPRT